MTQQDIIERDVRMLIGDLHLQLVMARARIAELEAAVADQQQGRPNGKPLDPTREATEAP
jgi:hypothetical protein